MGLEMKERATRDAALMIEHLEMEKVKVQESIKE